MLPAAGACRPEWGQLPIPQKLLRAGVRDMVHISDARMSGTAFGTAVLHVAPEAEAGGPLALVRSGDTIVLDVDARRLDMDVPESELAGPSTSHLRRSARALYLEHMLQADEGCDFDFLHGRSQQPDDEPSRPRPRRPGG
jgi:dihydroxyacid dehydratase/phosphogluconate dehydratase